MSLKSGSWLVYSAMGIARGKHLRSQFPQPIVTLLYTHRDRKLLSLRSLDCFPDVPIGKYK